MADPIPGNGEVQPLMPEPCLFFLSLAPRGTPSQELPPGWRGFEADSSFAVEIAPGVRVAPLGTGDFMLPGGIVGRGAGIAVWAELPDVAEPAGVEWGIRFKPGGWPSEHPAKNEDDARKVLASMRESNPEWEAALIVRSPERPAGPWRLANEPATGEASDDG
jgi:hypothetical protein